jgi:hypothetical protein
MITGLDIRVTIDHAASVLVPAEPEWDAAGGTSRWLT